MKKSSTDLSHLESELYSIISTINNLFIKHENGLINQNFFHKALQNNYRKLRTLNLQLKDRNLSITNFVKRTKFIKEYNTALQIINEFTSKRVSLLNLDLRSKDESDFAQKLKKSVLDLPSLTSEITSSFITLMDAIKLSSQYNRRLILKFFNELKVNLHKLADFHHYFQKVKKIETHVKKNYTSLIENDKYREKVVNHLYEIYQEFQTQLKS